ncbi:Stn1 domain-containing protein [Mycena chlorophos]|uniref:CST complex subunit STN1 n=1 Tax=Mycena chlorophos TaxID=658473 RepID=A0A8H6TGU7_MYCCL|nr:Stn1 domain-containing protein [Mycena chlorophos]
MSLDPEQLNALWQWTLTPEAVAACLVQDVFGARESGQKGPSEFYWIGRVPCRTVRLIGIVVGVQIYESRIAYSVDDGTGVIECQERPTRTKGDTNELQASVSLGHTVVVVGRISPSRESRKILADSIARCRSPSEEPRHWLAVRDLHASHYSLDEPFVIPERPPPPSSTYTPSTPQHRTHTHSFRPQTPSTRSTFAPSSSPLQAPSSPQSQSSALQSPQKLRHPSKLRSRDLTGNTFRIYLKHYMYTAADRQPPSEPSTPTRSAPRPSPSSNSAEPRGFAVSYLRRVPSLALLAKQVAHAEWKRRALDEYNKAKAQGEHPSKPKPEKDPRKRRARTKRLFGWALQQMMRDGDVVSWEGERRSVEELEDGPASGFRCASGEASGFILQQSRTLPSTSSNGASTRTRPRSVQSLRLFQSTLTSLPILKAASTHLRLAPRKRFRAGPSGGDRPADSAALDDANKTPPAFFFADSAGGRGECGRWNGVTNVGAVGGRGKRVSGEDPSRGTGCGAKFRGVGPGCGAGGAGTETACRGVALKTTPQCPLWLCYATLVDLAVSAALIWLVLVSWQ